MRPIPLHVALDFPAGSRRSQRASRGAAVPLLVVLAAHLLLFVYLAEWRGPVPPAATQGIPISALVGIGRRLSLQPLRSAPVPAPKPPAAKSVKPETDRPRPPAPPSEKPLADPLDSLSLALKLPLVLKPILDAEPIALTKSAVAAAPSHAVAAPQEASAASAAPGAKPCDLFDRIQTTLQTSDPVRAAVATIPARAKSVANAVMIWDARWVDPASVGGARALDPIRQAVLDRVGEATGACQQDVVRGPRLVIVGDQRDHTVLAFGSGEWRWADLIPADVQPHF